MRSAVLRNEIATAHLVILPAHHAPLLAQEQGGRSATGSVATSQSFYLRRHGVPFRDGVKADIVTDRVEIITITGLSSLMNCALHENGAQGASKDEPSRTALIPDAEGMQ